MRYAPMHFYCSAAQKAENTHHHQVHNKHQTLHTRDSSYDTDNYLFCLPLLWPAHCSQVHGDPHVMKFGHQDGNMVTCNITGSMTLLENEFLQVSAVAESLSQAVPSSDVSIESGYH